MGADLLLTWLVHDKDKELDFEAGKQTIDEMPDDVLERRLEEVFPMGDDLDPREEAKALVDRLKEEFDNPSWRDAVMLEVRGAYVHIRGGTSWGDSPSDGWDAFVNVTHFPEVLMAIGFESRDLEGLAAETREGED